MKSHLSKTGTYLATFLAGAVLAGSIAVAANNQQTGSVKACADRKSTRLNSSHT